MTTLNTPTNNAGNTPLNGDANTMEDLPPPPPPPYMIGEHCRYLHLRAEKISGGNDNNKNINQNQNHHYLRWYCDWTPHLVEDPDDVLQDVVQEYCQPLVFFPPPSKPKRTQKQQQDQEESPNREFWKEEEEDDHHNDLFQDSFFLQKNKNKEQKVIFPVRTISIRLRPDAGQDKILECIQDAFVNTLYKDYHCIVHQTSSSFHAMGAGGPDPIFLAANVITQTHSKTGNMERRLWLRMYHLDQVDKYIIDRMEGSRTSSDTNVDWEKELHRIRVNSVYNGMLRHSEMQRASNTRIDTYFTEACALVQWIQQCNNNRSTGPAPQPTQSECSEFLKEMKSPSKSVRSIFDQRGIFPALSNADRDLFQESLFVFKAIWENLKHCRCSYDTLIDETKGFGRLGSTMDPDFIQQLGRLSQRQMITTELRLELHHANTIHGKSLDDYTELENLLTKVITVDYRVPIKDDDKGSAEEKASSSTISTSSTDDLRQALTDFTSVDAFPWNDTIEESLTEVRQRIRAFRTITPFDPILSLAEADECTEVIVAAIGKTNDRDQKEVLKRQNKLAMIRLAAKQEKVKRLLAILIQLPTNYPHLPQIMEPVQIWYEIASNAKTSNIRRQPIPILALKTTFGNRVCITPVQLILITGTLTSTVHVFDWVDIDIQHSNSNSNTTSATTAMATGATHGGSNRQLLLAAGMQQLNTGMQQFNKMTNAIQILENGKKVVGFSPRGMDAVKLVTMCQILKSMQEV